MTDLVKNGSKWLTYLMLIVAIVASYTTLQGRVNTNAEELDRQHASVEKVPVLEERVGNIQKSVDEIKEDLKAQTSEILQAIRAIRP